MTIMLRTPGSPLARLKTVRRIISELCLAARMVCDYRSYFRIATDLLLCRLLRFLQLPPSNKKRQIRMRGNICITYRLNLGDVQSICEVWLQESYKLPFTAKSDVLVDLGANIGLTSLWLAKRYGYSTIIALEPSFENARLARMNLETNGVRALVLEAAIGPEDATAFFDDNEESNRGRVSSSGRPVIMLTMRSVLSNLPSGTAVDLVKMDIEGGEEPLLNGNREWLGCTQAIIVEFHPTLIDYPSAINILKNEGFRYIASGTAHKDSMDTFVRRS